MSLSSRLEPAVRCTVSSAGRSLIALVPVEPKLYHIVHVDRLPSIIDADQLWCDAEMAKRSGVGTSIGMSKIKQRRLEELTLSSHPDIHVGECVPFYFYPRSVMLYVIHKHNDSELAYRGGQGPIIHMETDLRRVAAWADEHKRRWAFTTSNAGSYHFEDYSDIGQLDKLNWDAIQARDWRGERKEGKQAEFLMERSFSWNLVERIGVLSAEIRNQALGTVHAAVHRPPVEVRRDWYY